MATSRVFGLSREEIVSAARKFEWGRQMPKWTVIVEGRELPARPLVLQAAGVLPNDPTNSHRAVALLQARGFTVRYEGKSVDGGKSEAMKSEAELDQLLASL